MVEALSEFFGRPLRIVAPETGVDRGARGAVSIISRASVQHLAAVAGADEIDARRFRMLIEVDGVEPYEEDSWVGREIRIGPARVRVQGNIGRCLVTSRDPDSGTIDLPTLDLLGTYRRDVPATEPLPLGRLRRGAAGRQRDASGRHTGEDRLAGRGGGCEQRVKIEVATTWPS